ncbi:hypothetical protein EON65_40740 [archaeon]|nr:MAG: hypothetical protein EON65_40740 [archaeon]
MEPLKRKEIDAPPVLPEGKYIDYSSTLIFALIFIVTMYTESQPYTHYPFKPPSPIESSEDEKGGMSMPGMGGQISLNDSSSNEEATVLTK